MEEVKKYYVYIYLDPRKPGKYSYEGLNFSFLYEPFYVGKGNSDRYITHMKTYRLSKKTHLSNKINKIKESNIEPFIIKLYDNLSESDSMNFEKIIIGGIGKIINRNGPLVNITDGGEGVSGLKHTLSSRLKMSLKGENHPNWGKHPSYETRYKMSNNLKLNNPMWNPEVAERARQSKLGIEPWNKGKKETRDNVIKKLSEKKIKYKNIKAISKKTGEVFDFNNTNEVMLFVDKTHRMIMIYFEKGESKDFIWKYDKVNR